MKGWLVLQKTVRYNSGDSNTRDLPNAQQRTGMNETDFDLLREERVELRHF